MIEGLGDEVTVAVGLFILLLALVLAWLSTYVAEGSDPLLGSLMPAGRREPLLGHPVPPNPEAQRTAEPQVEKPEEGEQGQAGEQGAGSENASLDQMLDIQGVPKRGQPVTAVSEADEEPAEGEVDGGDGSQEEARRKVPSEEREADTEQESGTPYQDQEWRKRAGKGQEQTQPEEEMITVRLKFLNETEEVALVRPDDTIGTLKR